MEQADADAITARITTGTNEIVKDCDLVVEAALEKMDLKKELFHLRFQHAINQLDNPIRIEAVKKDIARVMTVLAEKNAKNA